MKKDQVKEIVQTGIKQLSEALQNGKSDDLMRYLSVMSRFHSYSFNNILLIAKQKPDATRITGFRAWKQLNRCVMKGEKGIRIFAPFILKNQENAKAGEQDSSEVFGFKVVHVFDISQTEGKDLPVIAQSHGDPRHYQAKLEDLVRSNGIELIYDDLDGTTDGVFRHGEIQIQHDLSISEKFSELVRELAHEILHHGDRKNETSKTVKETEAEAVAYVVCQAIGVKTMARSSDYIQIYCGNEETLAESMSHIQKAASMILDCILE
ncbi:MAG: ArdC family protein [Planctomycetota bacterium]